MDTDKQLTTAPHSGAELFRVSTDAAGMCKAIVTATARKIQGRSYVQVEGWQSIAIAHGCVASSGEVTRTDTGYRAIGRVIRMDNGQCIATAEGFVGDDEPTWNKRPEYARRAMAQTRAISRACRSAFAHVVVMMQAGLETTPAEEIPDGPMGPVTVEGEVMPRQEPRHEPRQHYDVGAGIARVSNAATLNDLKGTYKAEILAARSLGSKEAEVELTRAKDARKAELEQAQEASA